MRIVRPLLVAALAAPLLLAGGTAALAAPHTATVRAAAVSPSHRPVERFVAWQACKAAVWEWAEGNAADGSSVDTRLNAYRAGLEWRSKDGWYVQIAGKAHEVPTANNGSSFCLVKGMNGSPRIASYAYPR